MTWLLMVSSRMTFCARLFTSCQAAIIERFNAFRIRSLVAPYNVHASSLAEYPRSHVPRSCVDFAGSSKMVKSRASRNPVFGKKFLSDKATGPSTQDSLLFRRGRLARPIAFLRH